MRVIEMLLISPLFHLSMFLFFIGILNASGFWTDMNYDIPNGIMQLHVIAPLLGLTMIIYGVFYWDEIQESSKWLKIVVVFVAAWTTGYLQFMPLGLDMLAFIIETSETIDAKPTISQEKPWLLPLMTFVSLTLYPLLEELMNRGIKNRYKMMKKLSMFIIERSGS